jgi:hypothetical protein
MLSAMVLSASTVTYGTPADGTYFGSGNGATNFTIDTSSDGTLELGLSAIIRYGGPAAEDLSDYYVPAGDTTVPGKTGATWDFVYSVDTNVGGAGTTLSAYTYNIQIVDETTGNTANFDPSAIPDNSIQPDGDGFQNAETLSFPFLSSQMPNYSDSSTDTYQITLTATAGSGAIESDVIDVNVVTPEPQTWVLLGVGLAGLLIARRRSFSF